MLIVECLFGNQIEIFVVTAQTKFTKALIQTGLNQLLLARMKVNAAEIFYEIADLGESRFGQFRQRQSRCQCCQMSFPQLLLSKRLDIVLVESFNITAQPILQSQYRHITLFV